MTGQSAARSLQHRVAWVVVALVALALSWWSLYELALSYGVPPVLAAGVSLVFDAAAVICAGVSRRYAPPDSGTSARVAMAGLLVGSVYLNWTHARLLGLGVPAGVMFAAPAVVAVVLVELETAWTTRAERRAQGRVAPALPVLGPWSWVLHPARSLATVWAVTAAHTDAVRAAELARWRPVTQPVTGPTADPVIPPVTGPDQPGHDRAPVTGPPARPVAETAPAQPVTGQGDHDGDGDRALLTGMGTDAERVRHAARQLGSFDRAAVAGWLADRGQVVSGDALRTALRRARAAAERPDPARTPTSQTTDGPGVDGAQVVAIGGRRPA